MMDSPLDEEVMELRLEGSTIIGHNYPYSLSIWSIQEFLRRRGILLGILISRYVYVSTIIRKPLYDLPS